LTRCRAVARGVYPIRRSAHERRTSQQSGDGGDEQHVRHGVVTIQETAAHALADAMPLLVWTCAPDGTLRSLNRRWTAYTGQPIERGLTAGIVEQVHPDDRALLDAAWARALEDAEHTTGVVFDYRLRAADGSYHWHLGRLVPERDDGGRL